VFKFRYTLNSKFPLHEPIRLVGHNEPDLYSWVPG